jgi:hypothetical protein
MPYRADHLAGQEFRPLLLSHQSTPQPKFFVHYQSQPAARDLGYQMINGVSRAGMHGLEAHETVPLGQPDVAITRVNSPPVIRQFLKLELLVG